MGQKWVCSPHAHVELSHRPTHTGPMTYAMTGRLDPNANSDQVIRENPASRGTEQ